MEKAFARVDELIERIEELKKEEEFKTFEASPLLKRVLQLLEENPAGEQEDLEYAYQAYVYAEDVYVRMGRFSLAAEAAMNALRVACDLFRLFNVVAEDVDSVVSDLLRDRNVYVDDDCQDVRKLLEETPILKEKEVEKMFNFRMNRRRTIKNDPVEMSEEYLAVIDEVEEKIAKNRKMYGMGSCFEVWSLKQEYLAEKGITWTSPALLNPRVMFD